MIPLPEIEAQIIKGSILDFFVMKWSSKTKSECIDINWQNKVNTLNTAHNFRTY